MSPILRHIALPIASILLAIIPAHVSGFTNFYNFIGSKGANPYAVLIESGDILYGTTWAGGTGGNGTVFKIKTDGTGFTNFFNFNGSNGANPYAGLTLSG